MRALALGLAIAVGCGTPTKTSSLADHVGETPVRIALVPLAVGEIVHETEASEFDSQDVQSRTLQRECAASHVTRQVLALADRSPSLLKVEYLTHQAGTCGELARSPLDGKAFLLDTTREQPKGHALDGTPLTPDVEALLATNAWQATIADAAARLTYDRGWYVDEWVNVAPDADHAGTARMRLLAASTDEASFEFAWDWTIEHHGVYTHWQTTTRFSVDVHLGWLLVMSSRLRMQSQWQATILSGAVGTATIKRSYIRTQRNPG